MSADMPPSCRRDFIIESFTLSSPFQSMGLRPGDFSISSLQSMGPRPGDFPPPRFSQWDSVLATSKFLPFLSKEFHSGDVHTSFPSKGLRPGDTHTCTFPLESFRTKNLILVVD